VGLDALAQSGIAAVPKTRQVKNIRNFTKTP